MPLTFKIPEPWLSAFAPLLTSIPGLIVSEPDTILLPCICCVVPPCLPIVIRPCSLPLNIGVKLIPGLPPSSAVTSVSKLMSVILE